jgi:hypothetical protein
MLAALLLLGLTAFANTATNQAFACSLNDLTSCFNAGASSGGYYAGQQDAIYDHDHSLAYNNVAACCHSPDWNDQFSSGYNQEWNILQSQSTNQYSSVNVNNSPGATVNVDQTSHQNQDQSQSQGPSVDQSVGGCGDQ